MKKLTSEQASRLADDFLAMARAVADYRYQNSSKLNDEVSRHLKKQHEELLECVLKLYSLSPEVALEDAETALATISSVSARITQSYKCMESVELALELANKAAALCGAITSQNQTEIRYALRDVVSSWGQAA